MKPLASRYIAGETLAQALDSMESLKQKGHPTILDILGEDVEGEAAARAVAEAYVEAAREVAKRSIDAYVSIKPTHFGLRTNPELCFELYDFVARETESIGVQMRVEMEDHTTTDGTLEVYERLRKAHDNVGIVLQSRLFRTLEDIDRLAPGPLWVRMVKGIYLEPETVAHTDPEPIRDAYVEATAKLFDRGAYVSCATHDEFLAERLFALAKEKGVGPDRYELQVLLGVRSALWRQWREAGHQVRVYVPYGPEWKPYSLRRMRKNPEIFRHVVRGIFSGQ